MSKIDDWLDTLTGGKIDWEQMNKLIQADTQANRTDRGGPFVGWEWGNQLDADGNIMYDENGQAIKSGRQGMVINEAFQPAVDRLGQRATQQVVRPGQGMGSGMDDLWRGKMANQLARHGMDNSAYLPPAPPEEQDDGMPPKVTPGGGY